MTDNTTYNNNLNQENGSTNQAPKNNNKIKNIIGVMSGKGGVGKSTVTTMLAKSLNDKGYKVGILDADITGPSIPRLMNMENIRARATSDNILPVVSDNGIKVISLNLLVGEEDTPVIWRGPMISSVVQQFYSDVLWGELDYLLIDMPPGTGDVALTVMQSLPITGVVMVSLPQNMVSMIVAKAVNMANQLKVPVFGVIENMSYMTCPNCSEKIKIYSDDELGDFLQSSNLELLAELPMSPEIVKMSNNGVNEMSEEISEIIGGASDRIIESCKKNRIRMFLK